MKLIVGIDTGVQTGYAIWNKTNRVLIEVTTVKIHIAMERVLILHEQFDVLIRFEDARLRKWFGNSGKEQLQGAGSIKGDAVIWEDFCKDKGIKYECVAPRHNVTKLTAASFRAITKWPEVTNNHGRDAAMLVYGF